MSIEKRTLLTDLHTLVGMLENDINDNDYEVVDLNVNLNIVSGKYGDNFKTITITEIDTEIETKNHKQTINLSLLATEKIHNET